MLRVMNGADQGCKQLPSTGDNNSAFTGGQLTFGQMLEQFYNRQATCNSDPSGTLPPVNLKDRCQG